MIWNKKLIVRTNNSNIIKYTEIEVKTNLWNVLYYRYEGFLPSHGDNKFYLQLYNGKETVLDFEKFDINNYAGNNNNINLGFASAGSYPFIGTVDWVIIGLGRMTPANTQYLVKEYKN